MFIHVHLKTNWMNKMYRGCSRHAQERGKGRGVIVNAQVFLLGSPKIKSENKATNELERLPDNIESNLEAIQYSRSLFTATHVPHSARVMLTQNCISLPASHWNLPPSNAF